MTEHSISAPPIWQTDPARVKRVAVVKGQRLCIFEDAVLIEDDEVYPEDQLRWLAHHCLNLNCAAMWIAPPHAVDWLTSAREMLAESDRLHVHPLTTREGTLAGLVAQRDGRGVPMGIYFLDSGDMWNIAGLVTDTDAGDLALGLSLAARLLEMQLRFTPSYTGLQMLRQELAHKRYDIPPLSERAHELVTAHLPTYVQWNRPITHLDDVSIIRKYDRNSSFTASAGLVPVGEPRLTHSYVPGYPGLYQVFFAFRPEHFDSDFETLPGPFHVGEGAGEYPLVGKTWAWEPQIRQAISSGRYDLRVLESWYWPEYHDLFRTWRERLWQARQMAEAAGGAQGRIARAIIKRVGVAAVGRLNQKRAHAVMSVDQAEEEGRRILHYETDEQMEFTGLAEVIAELGKTDLLRPDWWATIIAGANERLFSALYAHAEALPVAAYVDAVYCLLPWPEGDIEPARLGKWKLEREVRVSWAELEELNQLNAAPWVKRLAAIAREQGAQADEGENGEAEEAE